MIKVSIDCVNGMLAVYVLKENRQIFQKGGLHIDE